MRVECQVLYWQIETAVSKVSQQQQRRERVYELARVDEECRSKSTPLVFKLSVRSRGLCTSGACSARHTGTRAELMRTTLRRIAQWSVLKCISVEATSCSLPQSAFTWRQSTREQLHVYTCVRLVHIRYAIDPSRICMEMFICIERELCIKRAAARECKRPLAD